VLHRGVLGVLKDLPVWLRWLMLGQFVNATGSLVWIYLTLYLVANRDLTVAQAGLVAGANGIGTIVGNLVGGSFGDRFGMRRAALVTLVTASACKLAVPVTPTVLLAGLVGLSGLLGGATRPLLSATIAAEVPPERRREGIALSRSALNAGTVIGPPVGALLAAHWFGAVFVVDAVTTLLLVAVIMRFVPRDREDTAAVARAAGSLWSALRRDRRVVRLLLTIVVVDTVYRLMFTVVPLQLRALSVPTVAYGLLVSLNCLVIVLLEAPTARRLRHLPAVPVVTAGAVLVGAAYVVFGLRPGLVAAVLAMLVLTVGEMLYKPTATAHAVDLAPPGLVGRYQSAYGAASISGTMLSPALGGLVYDAAPSLLWPLAGVAAASAGLLLLARDRAHGAAASVREESAVSR
jgi:predicted MFS family arabinose efflux permease